ncbi:MAG TPA: type IV toxin-antitoxin system AbiEi family antitoxin domain-containing protein [Solirubrobacteraceae bacterium]|nr:type IV toxin-antitoxin system AbiEi family antitoxin domain-containing protein [Solirubrobacteraceae bacterium]
MPVEGDISPAIRQERRLQALAARQRGLITCRQLIALGFSGSAIARRLALGRLHRVHRGVYVVGRRELSREGVFLAAVLAVGDDAVLSHFAAAALYECWTGRTTPIDVTVPRKMRRRTQIRIHGVGELPADATTTHRGIPVTTPARTVRDLAGAMYSARAYRRVVHEALARKLLTPATLQAEIDGAGPHCRGIGRLRAEIAAGVTPTRSGLEDDVVEMLRRHEVPRFQTNVHVPGTPGWVEVDVLFPAHRLVIEVDGTPWHATPFRREFDAYKQSLVKAAGHHLIRLTEDDVTAVTEPLTMAEILGALT